MFPDQKTRHVLEFPVDGVLFLNQNKNYEKDSFNFSYFPGNYF